MKTTMNEEEVNTDSGFTLIEVLVAMLIGLIMMAMAVAILGVTNSASLRVLAKSEAQQNVRNSVVKLLDNLSNASSLETCRVAENPEDQTLIGANGTFSGDCKEFVRTGLIVAWAADNKLCYFDKLENNSVDDFPELWCITRGGPDAYNSGDGSLVLEGINIEPCVSEQPNITDPDPDLIYLYSCSSSGGSRGDWPSDFDQPDPDDISVIADIGLDDGFNPPAPIVRLPIFEYIFDGLGTDLVNIVAIDANFSTRYGVARSDEVSQFQFNQTVLLKESNKVTEEEYDG